MNTSSKNPDFSPVRQRARAICIPHLKPIEQLSLDALKTAHAQGLEVYRKGGESCYSGVNWLAIKAELARRLLQACDFCVHDCRVNRSQQELGYCRLGDQAVISGEYIHHGEEAPIAPTHAIFFSGCTMHCLYCHNWRETFTIEAGETLDAQVLVKRIEARIAQEPVKTISFIGGTPEPHLHTIAELARDLPVQIQQPLVFNGNGTLSASGLALMEGLIDIYLPDFKHGNDRCAWETAKIAHYMDSVIANLRAYQCQGVQVLVRHLVLPGHTACCTRPVLDILSREFSEFMVNIMYQYRPMYLTRERGVLNRRLNQGEIDEVEGWKRELGLVSVSPA